MVFNERKPPERQQSMHSSPSNSSVDITGQVTDILKEIIEPKTGKSIIENKMVSGVSVQDNLIIFTLSIDPNYGPEMEGLRIQAEQAIAKRFPTMKVQALLTANKKSGQKTTGQTQFTKEYLPQIKNIIAVASGKGGVGKSTVATNLAVSFAKLGYKTGLLDADIYGPSIPTMMGKTDRPMMNEKEKIVPAVAHGVTFMSIGFMIDIESPLIWRGPMVQSALTQLVKDVDWGDLDVLIIDMPPGTGDIQLTAAQKIPLSGAVIVSTPQDIALIDARKAINMFKKVDVPILGIVENMGLYHCPNCGHESHIFGEHGVEKTAKDFDIPFLGSIPLNIKVREQGDAGSPISIHKNEEIATTFEAISQQCLEILKKN